jgi:hypothetical protein
MLRSLILGNMLIIGLQQANASPQTAIDAFEKDSQVRAAKDQLASDGFKPASSSGAAIVYFTVGDEGTIQHYLVSRPYKKGIMDNSALIAAYVRLPGGGPVTPGKKQKAQVKLLDGTKLKEALDSLPAH